MGAAIPKQYLLLGSMPILLHSIKNFNLAIPEIEVVVVISPDMEEEFKALMHKHLPQIAYKVAFAGKERYHSVKSGIEKCNGQWVAIHDAVRPFASVECIQGVFQLAAKTGAAIPVIPVKDSIRQQKADGNKALNRDELVAVQTPQVFSREILEEAYKIPYRSNFTDDASVVEAAGYTIHLSQGNPENLKITNPLDLKLAELILHG